MVLIAVLSDIRALTQIQNLRKHLFWEALMPGFVNAHSHAFQRGLRGLGETYPKGSQSSFWTWRQSMYSLVSSMSEARVREYVNPNLTPNFNRIGRMLT